MWARHYAVATLVASGTKSRKTLNTRYGKLYYVNFGLVVEQLNQHMFYFVMHLLQRGALARIEE